MAKFKMIDYGGILLNLAGCLLILIPLSGGGIAYAWNSALVISMLAIGGAIWVAFGLWEWKIARMPIMPCRSDWAAFAKNMTDKSSETLRGTTLLILVCAIVSTGKRLLWQLLLP